MSGIIFGIIDNGIMIVGALFGLHLENLLPRSLKRGLGTVIGAGIGNAVSDFFGGIGEGDLQFATGTFIGCLIALIFIPIFKKIIIK